MSTPASTLAELDGMSEVILERDSGAQITDQHTGKVEGRTSGGLKVRGRLHIHAHCTCSAVHSQIPTGVGQSYSGEGSRCFESRVHSSRSPTQLLSGILR